ncbi:hypothetical protein BFV94_2354 [Alteromonas macleodii]|uniref:Uncharacterized protein n=1 Tax=Alteromonas macleodii TaxID=28108 RepID=A0AB36FYH5_ALTMA|nr:hypothetical protein BFV93_2349 [Alteromonas macleodii]OES31416.1 hypothetical protein BFV95_2355 [Alteromonas macleodii]OES31768.1 hypothetical protein BFV94_2354 [Alteromonas macleodii]OES41087.1 hypothetical protein BFV96_2340 [Alteromonas macleodii]
MAFWGVDMLELLQDKACISDFILVLFIFQKRWALNKINHDKVASKCVQSFTS